MTINARCSYVLFLAVSAYAHVPQSFTMDVFMKTSILNEKLSNFIVSPYSLVAPLGTLALASEGNSQKQILKGFCYKTTDQVEEMYTMCKQHLIDIKDVVLKSSSRLYISNRVELLPEFNEAAQHVYDVVVKSEDFSNLEKIANEINVWVANETENRIKMLIAPSSLSSSTSAVLVNSIYFDGKWKNRFEESIDKNFYTDNSAIIVPTMTVTTELGYGYIRKLEAEVVNIPYNDKHCSFVVILPKNNTNLNNLLNILQNDKNVIKNVLKVLPSKFIELSMPVFEFETTTDLKDMLEKLGISDIFSSKANLTRMMKHNLNVFVESAIQKAYIKVNEDGTQAAAANAFIIGYMSAALSPAPLHVIAVNRPFYFEIRCSEITLFNGIVRRP